MALRRCRSWLMASRTAVMGEFALTNRHPRMARDRGYGAAAVGMFATWGS
jgi:hypothetical protein